MIISQMSFSLTRSFTNNGEDLTWAFLTKTLITIFRLLIQLECLIMFIMFILMRIRYETQSILLIHNFEIQILAVVIFINFTFSLFVSTI